MSDTTLDKLLERIKQPAIFVIPQEYFNHLNIDKKYLNGLNQVGFFNHLIYTNDKGNTKHLEHAYECMAVLNRPKILSSNLFEVLRLRNDLNDEAFIYFLDKYYEELENAIKLTEITQQKAKECAKNYIEGIQNYLELQHQQNLDHQAELDKHFKSWRNRVAIARLLKSPLPSYEEIKKQPKVKVPEIPVAPKLEAKQPKKKAKTALPTISEVDADLLFNVFNIDSNLINRK